MSKPHLLQMGGYPDWDEVPLQAAFTVHRYDQAPDKAEFLAKVGPLVRGIATSGGLGVSGAVIAACPMVEIISVYGVGYDAVDMTAARSRGIVVTNTPDVLTEDCADLAVAMLLALSRGVVGADAWARSGQWAARGAYPLQRRVSGLKVGILGLGRIGAAVARRLEGFGCPIAYASRGEKPCDYRYIPDPVALADWADVLIVTALANAETRHIVNAEVLRALGPQGMLVNISRASNIDEAALLEALEGGALAGAALDVFEGEPALNPRFGRLANVVLQPHHASGTVETRRAMGQLMRDNLMAHFAGRPVLTPV